MNSSFQPRQHDHDETFQVTLKGLQLNASPIEARAKLAALFKASPEQVDRLITTHGYVLKKGCTFDVATKYKNAIEAAGAVCELVSEAKPVVSLDADLPEERLATAEKAQVSRPETILFQGDMSLIKGMLRITTGSGIGTPEKFVFFGDKKGDITLHRSDIKSIEDSKFGFATKWIVTTITGQRYQFTGTNAAALKLAMLTLSGQEVAAGTFDEPKLSDVKNGTAWLAAFGPSLSGVILFAVGTLFHWNLQSENIAEILKMGIFKLVIIIMFLRIDKANLQSQGYNTVKLGIVSPENPRYLFSRAKAFGHGKGYAITWCVLFSIELLYIILA